MIPIVKEQTSYILTRALLPLRKERAGVRSYLKKRQKNMDSMTKVIPSRQFFLIWIMIMIST